MTENININVNGGSSYGPESKWGRQSFFDGGLLSFIGWSILGTLITVFTFGICYPWALCMVYGWKINHTVVDGHRMKFNGSAVGLFGNWIKWLVLTVITLGIYGFWVSIKLEDWKVKNTTFVN
ncbi:YjgN family protein [Bacillus cereus]|nr:YjgN family protein [Bacillus cereus]